MTTLTTRIGLAKEADSQNYSVETVNANSDKVDAAVGFLEATSSTRPSSPYNGQAIRESDTGSLFVSNGSVPASGSWLPIWGANGPVVVGAVGVNAPLRGQTTSTLVNNRFIDARKFGETYPGWQVDFDGRQQWGPGGATVPDTWLYRSAAATLRTGGALIVDGALTVVGSVSGSIARGIVGGRQITGTNNLGSALTTTETMPTNMHSGSISLPASRRFQIHARFKSVGSVTDDIFLARIREGASSGTSGNQLVQANIHNHVAGNGSTGTVIAEYETAGSAVSRIFSFTAQRVVGTGNMQFIGGDTGSLNVVGVWVYDVGPAGLVSSVAS